jgi:hypothetical protein
MANALSPGAVTSVKDLLVASLASPIYSGLSESFDFPFHKNLDQNPILYSVIPFKENSSLSSISS